MRWKMELKFTVKSWLLTILVVVSRLQVSDGCLENERLALLPIKAFFAPYPTQESFDPFSSWVGANCCNWVGVICNLSSGGHVIKLFLADMVSYGYKNRSYSLNVSLFQSFTQLKSLDLSFNGLIGFTENKGFNKFPSLNKLETLIIGENKFGKDIWLSLSGLTSLKSLGLSGLGLEGSTIGLQELKKLKRLERLDLEVNHFNNSIFSSLSELTDLKELFLSNNRLEGFVPTQDIAKLKSLEILDIRSNRYFGGAIPFQDLKKLRVLDMSFNQFNGSIQGLCEGKSLVELNIRDNHFTGQFSKCVGNLTRLKLLDISRNQFNGKIPSTISNLTSIELLSLEENYFEGPFSFSSFANHSNLRYFMLPRSDVGNIQVETEEPRWKPTFQLKVLSLPRCNLNKQTASNIPSFLLSQHELIFIDLSHNQLVGTSPLWLLHNNSKLRSLDLSDNLFTGTLQLPIWKHNLSYLQISGNNFSGQLPNNIGLLLPQVSYFNISRNDFEGNLPQSMEQMEDLVWLDLSNNKFSGDLQISMFNNMLHLRCLVLASNNFSGTIEHGLKNTLSLLVMDISNNMMSGQIPNWIGSLDQLRYVQMSNNHFEGELPIGMCSLRQLIFLDVSQNKLFGGVPSCFNSPSLVYLYMQKNRLSGHIPHVLLTASGLKVLDLSYNHFFGYVPSWLENYKSLRVLLLKGNELQGPIPRQLCQVREISIMDFSSNKLDGSIPSCLNNITFGMVKAGNQTILNYDRLGSTAYAAGDSHFVTSAHYLENPTIVVPTQVIVDFTLKYRLERYKGNILEHTSGLDLSNNRLSGNIPPQIGDLLQIRALNFSHNKLVGFIPKEISNLKQLESLDLSFNSLSGNIPSQLAELNYLAIFNVSYNNLSGMIPTSPQFQTFPESSYYGNSICGPFIEQKCSSVPLPPNNQPMKIEREHEGIIDFEVFYWSFAGSSITILLGFVIVLYINLQWRQRWFDFIEDCCFYLCKYIRNVFVLLLML